jgi:SPP1 family predicted phage head-tail adaptor
MARPVTVNPLVLNSGELRQLIQIQSQSLAPDAVTGMPIQTWVTVRTTWARIVSPSSAERFLTDQFTDLVTHAIVIRYTATPVSGGMRVLFGSRVFQVQTIDNVQERNVRLNLMCLEIDGVV